jgi:hypothetical protein
MHSTIMHSTRIKMSYGIHAFSILRFTKITETKYNTDNTYFLQELAFWCVIGVLVCVHVWLLASAHKPVHFQPFL